MRKSVATIGVTVIALGALMALSNCQNQNQSAQDAGGDTAAAVHQAAATMDPVAHGKYLVTLSGCNDCHSPKKMTPQGPVPDESLLLSGHPANDPALEFPGNLTMDKWIASTNMHLSAWAGPWGISYAANLTPDTATGLGAWDAETFIATMRTGKHMGTGRDILMPMPWFNYALATDDDLMAIFAYLQSLPPISNQVPQPTPPPGGEAPQGGGTQ